MHLLLVLCLILHAHYVIADISNSIFPTGRFWLCEKDWPWEEDMDVLWDSRICGPRGYYEQRPWFWSWLLVFGHPHIWTSHWQVSKIELFAICRKIIWNCLFGTVLQILFGVIKDSVYKSSKISTTQGAKIVIVTSYKYHHWSQPVIQNTLNIVSPSWRPNRVYFLEIDPNVSAVSVDSGWDPRSLLRTISLSIHQILRGSESCWYQGAFQTGFDLADMKWRMNFHWPKKLNSDSHWINNIGDWEWTNKSRI